MTSLSGNNKMRKIDWLTVRNFGRVKYFNLAYVVIIGMPLFAQAYEVMLRTLFKIPFDITLTFPFTFKLLYISSLCYAIGIALYHYFCPTIIKNHETELAYVDAAQEIYERAYPDRKYDIALTHLEDAQTDVRNNLILLRQKLDRLFSDPTSRNEDRKEIQENLNSLIEWAYPRCIQPFLTKKFEEARTRYPAAIYASGFFFMAGTILLFFLLIRKTIHLFFV
jgi:hypothetical protein